MTAILRVVLDRPVPARAALGEAAAELTRALQATAPAGCEVSAILPRGEDAGIDGLADPTRLALPRRELAASWQLGVVRGVGKGMIHAPTLLAPLVRHDRVHDVHQVVATVWDLRAEEAPDTLGRAEVLWEKAMLKRAERHADAVVVPTHAMAARLSERGRFAGRIRVLAGAAPAGLRVPNDVVGRLRSLGLPATFAAVSGGAAESDGLLAALRALAPAGLDVVVLDTADGGEPAVAEVAEAAGVGPTRVHVRGHLEPFDRAAVLGSAAVFVAPSARSDWPWRAVEALTAGTPVVAVDSPAHREVLADAALFADAAELAAAVEAALGGEAARLRVLAADRAKAFSWREHAERVWQLHAEL